MKAREIRIRPQPGLLAVTCLIETAFRAVKEVGTGNKVWYRGQASAYPSWKLRPKVHRTLARNGDEVQLFDRGAEAEMTAQFLQRAHTRYDRCPALTDHCSWLCLMQHYGLPTRLLDWTESLLVAAWFAVSAPVNPEEQGAHKHGQPDEETTERQTEEDAALWVLNPNELNVRFIGHAALPLLSAERRAAGASEPRDEDEGEKGRPLSDLIAELVEPALHREMDYHPAILAVHYPEFDLRMLLQHSMFTIHGSPTPLEGVDGAEHFLTKIIIPGEMKGNLRACLISLDIRRCTLFPDLDHLAKQLADDRYEAKLYDMGMLEL